MLHRIALAMVANAPDIAPGGAVIVAYAPDIVANAPDIVANAPAIVAGAPVITPRK